MSNWPSGSYVNPWTEIYALHFLVEANKQGYNVPQYFLDGLLKYQADRAKQWKNNIDYKQGETIQAYRLFVLALAGKAEMGAMNRFKELDMIYDLTKVLAAGAFAQTGKTNIAQKLLPAYEDGKAMSDYYSSFGSLMRDLSFLTYVQMLCDVDQQTVQNNINEVCRMMSTNRWMDTQTTAFSLFVLGKYAEKMNVKNTNLSATVKANGDERTLNTNMASVGYGFTPKLGSNTVEVKNNTDQKFQLVMWCENETQYSELRSEREIPYEYRLVEENHRFRKEGEKYFRVSKIYRETIDKESGEVIKKELLLDNHSEVMYDYSMIPQDQIRDE